MSAVATPSNETPISSVRQFRRFALAVCVVGVAAQLVLTAYYLSMGHAAAPHDLPVGLIARRRTGSRSPRPLEKDGAFAVTEYASADALITAIRHRDVYGGVDLTGQQPHLYLASAAGPAAATVLRSTYTSVVQQRAGEQVTALAKANAPVPVATVQALTTPPPVTDVVPLPADDRNAASLGFLVQALALGGTIASLGLGRLIPRTRRS